MKYNKAGETIILILGVYWGYRMLRKEYTSTNDTAKAREIDLLARTVYGEARGETSTGQQAVMSTILNRVKKGGWYGATVEDVVLKPYQFSCWNAKTVGTTNKTELSNYNQMINATVDSDFIFAYLHQLATTALNEGLHDYSGGATHYHAKSIKPYWADRLTKTAEIGNHVFYV